jgi:hypothetical protein
MSRKEKLKQALLNRPSKFKWDDLVAIMKHHGYVMKNARGGGSSRSFYNATTGDIKKWHQPHPGNEVLQYVVDEAIELIKESDNEK